MKRKQIKGFVGMTHLGFLIFRNKFETLNKLFLKLWKRFLCPYHIHLFDECLSDKHYLVCDACQLDVVIKTVDVTYCDIEEFKFLNVE